jgi:hypothetical protein
MADSLSWSRFPPVEGFVPASLMDAAMLAGLAPSVEAATLLK